MKCPSCGASVGGRTVCPACGAVQPDPTGRSVARVKKLCTMTNLLIVSILLLILVVAGAVLGALFKPEPAFGYALGDTVTFWQSEDGYTAARAGKLLSSGTEEPYRTFCSADLGLAAYVSNGRLTLADATGVHELPISAASVFCVSRDGSSVFYRDADGQTVQYTVALRRQHVIAADTAAASVTSLVPSPDGRSAVYAVTSIGDSAYVGSKMYFFNGSESIYIGRNAVPLATDNAGLCIYATSGGTVYRYTKENDERIPLGETLLPAAETNRDATEILFTGTDGTLLLAVPGKDTVRLAAGTCTLCEPRGCGRATVSSDTPSVVWHDFAHFSDVLYCTGAAVCRLTDGGLTEWFAAGWNSRILWSADEQYLFSLENGILVRRAADGSDDGTVLAENVTAFEISRDGKTVYYTDRAKTLYALSGSSKLRRIADDVSRIDVTGDGIFWFLVDDVWYVSVNVRSKKPVLSDVILLVKSDSTVYAVTADGLYATGGAEITKLADGAFVPAEN